MDNFLHTLTLSDIDIEDLVWSIETTLNNFPDDMGEENPLYSGYRNLESLHTRLLAGLKRG